MDEKKIYHIMKTNLINVIINENKNKEIRMTACDILKSFLERNKDQNIIPSHEKNVLLKIISKYSIHIN